MQFSSYHLTRRIAQIAAQRKRARNAPKRLARQQNLLPRKGKEGTYAMEWGGK
jgi:hypothetical protein